MRLSPVILLSAVVVVSAFQPVIVPSPSIEESEWKPISGTGEKRNLPEVHSLKLKRQPYSDDDGAHPEIIGVRAANRATEKFRRSGIAGPDVDGELAIRQVEQSLQKRGLLRKRQSSGIIITEVGQATATGGIIPAETPKTPDSMGIGQDGTDVSYFSEVQFGSENKTFVLVIDTGSSDTWIPSSQCTSKACKIHSTFGPSDSTTLKTSQTSFDIKYGSGDVKGFVVSDSIKFAGFELTTSFGVATEVSDDFVSFPIDGIMGLGFSNGSQQKVRTIMDDLVDNGLIKAKLFGIALSRHTDPVNDGVINFGGIDSGLFDGDLTFSSSVSADGLWELKVDDAGVDGNAMLLSGRTAVIDSGTSLLLLPPADALALHSMIPGAEVSGETFAVPCDTKANVEFTFSGVTYKVAPVDYVGTAISLDNMCLSLIISRQILGKTTWILGDVFLKNVYSVFDLDNNRIGFAPRKKRAVSSTTATHRTSAATKSAASSTLQSAPSPTTTNDLPTASTTRSTSGSDASPIGNASPFGESVGAASSSLILSRSLLMLLAPSCILTIAVIVLL